MYTLMDAAGGNQIAESASFHWRDLEADLVYWWLQQSTTQSDLLTSDGEHLIVIDPGQLNDGAGPDLLNCHLILDDRELVGSVEMHRQARDWFGHGHDRDPHYQEVILHVVKQGQGGPDIPTLVLHDRCRLRSYCLARQSISPTELFQAAENRFKRKVDHIQALESRATAFDPLLLGMCEIILAGSRRHTALQELAVRMGLTAWPDAKVWSGSRQAYPRKRSLPQLLDRLIDKASVFETLLRDLRLPVTWDEWDMCLSPLIHMGLSRNQGREWVVNILAPYWGQIKGFELWLNMQPFRHYGAEKQTCRNVGIASVNTIAEQQALLEWREILCVPGNCPACPLTHSHQALAWFD